jgi:rfaE bifunctional protein kinase chain/domain
LVVFQDYDKGFITPELISKTVTYTKERNIFTAVDPKRKNFLNYREVSLFKPNRKELFEGLNLPVSNSITEVYKAVEQLQKRISAGCIMTTLSEDGVVISCNNKTEHLPAIKRQIADVSGAGDTVISIASLMMVAGATPKETAFLANLGGGIVCEYPGVVAIDKKRLMEEALKYPL